MKKVTFCIFLLFILNACTNGEQSKDTIIFQSKGKQWEAIIQDKVYEHDGKQFFKVIYNYNGDLDNLQEVERISFAQGTSLGTQVLNLYDPSYKEKLVNKGEYQEEYELQNGIFIEEIKKRNTKEFSIEYALMKSGNDFTTLDAIKKDRVAIIINWETQSESYEDKIH